MGKPWFGPLPPVFVVFPITWQGWGVVIASQVVIVLVRILVPELVADPVKGARAAAVLAWLIEGVYFAIIIWKVGSRRRRNARTTAD